MSELKSVSACYSCGILHIDGDHDQKECAQAMHDEYDSATPNDVRRIVREELSRRKK